eukprot:Hpha_TRINITY_DN16198_c2_g1::TRINITY_DN16198_c2_g1_i1::g.6271::m.6271
MLGWLTRRAREVAQRIGEDVGTANIRGAIAQACVFLLILLLANSTGVVPFTLRSIGRIGAFLIMAVLIVLILFSSIATKTILILASLSMAVAVAIIDFASQMDLAERAWPLFILNADVLLLAGALEHCRYMVIVILIYLWVERGLLIATPVHSYATFGSDLPVGPCDCAEPPCSGSVMDGFSAAILYTAVYAADFMLTRSFVTAMQVQMKAVELTVQVAEKIATFLSDYNVDDAREVVLSQGEALPLPLHNAFEVLLTNLERYRPFIPDSVLLLEEQEGDEDEIDPLDQVIEVPPPGAGLDTGHLTIVFTDIQSSTALWEAHPQGMYEGLQVHNNLIRKLANLHEGYEVKTIGDAFMLCFGDIKEACAFAMDTQVELTTQNWSADLLEADLCKKQVTAQGTVLWRGLRIRVGIHTGQIRPNRNPVTERYDYFGPPVNVAARLEAAAGHGGLTAVSNEVVLALGADGVEDIGAEAIPLGLRELKGVRNQMQITVLVPKSLAQRKELLNKTKLSLPKAEGPGRNSPSGSICLSPNTVIPVPKSPSARRFSRNQPGTPLTSLTSTFQAGPGRVGRPSRSQPRLSSATAHAGGSSSGDGASIAPMKLSNGLRKTVATCVHVRLDLASAAEGSIEMGVVITERAADMSQGMISSFLGSSCVVTFNAGRHCIDHVNCARRFVGKTHTDATKRTLPFHYGVATSSVLSGNVGSVRRRFATVVGVCIELSSALADQALMCGDRAFACGVSAQDAPKAFLAEVWRVGTTSQLRVYNVSAEPADEGEMMCDLEESQRMSVVVSSDELLMKQLQESAFAEVRRGNEKAARDLLLDGTDQMRSPAGIALRFRVKRLGVTTRSMPALGADTKAVEFSGIEPMRQELVVSPVSEAGLEDEHTSGNITTPIVDSIKGQ